MKAREYNKRIEVWETTERVSDGFGGYIAGSPQLISRSWAKLVTEGLGRKAYSFGIIEFKDPLLFLVRGRNDLPYNGRNLFLVYKGDKYIIQGIRNENLRDVDTEIFCTKDDPLTVPYIGVITT
ncbi:phage head completion protein [Pedobacter africanus]|uniref:Phage head-tail joining protein n=1 Tax=Pedobacter africanus TaxID=151894 RepID=A0A1W1ZBH7_9SPHI|nr:head-tail adaptor protein [Pedobacter africanus]SMC45765.1 Phage head-tail joining protein [Pedobacter africanus]